MLRTLSAAVALYCVFVSTSHSQFVPPTPPEPTAQAPAPVQEPPPQNTLTPAPAEAPAAAAMKNVAPAGSRAPAARESVAPDWWQSPGWWLLAAVLLLALVAVALAIYTARLWKATAALLGDVRDTARKELRAYVALDDIFFSEAGESAAGVHKLRIRNYGQTPASRMSIWCERATHLPQEGVKPFYDSPLVDGQLLHPVQAFTLGLSAAPLYRIGKPGFFTYGRIIYHDIYDQWWVTKFCYRYEGDGSFVPHGDYNAEEGPFDKAPA